MSHTVEVYAVRNVQYAFSFDIILSWARTYGKGLLKKFLGK